MLKDCKYFDMVGNRCSRVTDGKCDDLPECEFLSKEHSFTNPKGQCKIKLKDCKFINNCQYRQLKRLEQENVELKAENARLIEGLGIANKYVNKYHQTLQEIKAIVKNICDGCTSECDCDEDCNYFLITEALTKAESEG